MKQKTLNQYETFPLLPGVRTDFTKPLCIELIEKGQSEVVFKLLYSVGLKITENASPPGFKILTI